MICSYRMDDSQLIPPSNPIVRTDDIVLSGYLDADGGVFVRTALPLDLTRAIASDWRDGDVW
jgi:hypothetical protein